MLRRILSVVALVFAVSVCPAVEKSTSPKPKWLNQLPTPTNNSFRYERYTAIAPSLDGARNDAMHQLIRESGLKNGAVVVTETTSKRRLNQHWANGRLTENYDVDTRHKTDIKGEEQTLYIEKVAEYWERRNGQYYYTGAYAKSELGRAPLFDNVTVTRNYGARGLWRSLLIPGWGQIYKGSTAKGCIILGSTAICVIGAVVADNQRSDYVKKINHTHDSSLIKSYRTKRDHWTTGRNVCIGAAAALYVYNIIDALVAPGAERLVVHNYGRNGGFYSVVPAVDADGAFGLAASITF